MISDLTKCPWPWFGGKRDAAPAVWAALGDVDHYVEPFAGSLAALLCRPHPCNRPYFSETVNDLDGLVCNFWRALAKDADAVAEAASWPVCEADLHARHLALLAWRNDVTIERLMGDPDYCDPRMAGWWAWGLSCWIGSGWCSGNGAWIVGADGRITKRGQGGVARQIPHLGNDGQGANRPQLREPGVARQIPHLGNDGQGANHAGCREEGVGDDEFHPMTMPELRRWLRFLAARLRHVRVLNGPWERSLTSGVLQTLPVRQGGIAGAFLDPPYATDVRTAGVYSHDGGNTVAAEVREWCRENGDNPRYRIVLAGYDTEHVELESLGWTTVEWFKSGFLKGGMAQQSEKGTQQKRERLWLSPHCLRPAADKPRQQSLFGGDR